MIKGKKEGKIERIKWKETPKIKINHENKNVHKNAKRLEKKLIL